MNISEIISDSTYVYEFITDVSSEGKTDTTRTDQLLSLLEKQYEEFENSFSTGTTKTRARLLALLLAASNSPLPSLELLSLATVNRSHDSMLQEPPVSIIIQSLANVTSDCDMPSSVRDLASKSMLSVATPAAYFQEEGKCNVDGKSHNDHNEIPIDRLTKVYSQAVNVMISAIVDHSLVRKISASLAAVAADKDENIIGIADSVMEFTRILLQNSTQNVILYITTIFLLFLCFCC